MSGCLIGDGVHVLLLMFSALGVHVFDLGLSINHRRQVGCQLISRRSGKDTAFEPTDGSAIRRIAGNPKNTIR